MTSLLTLLTSDSDVAALHLPPYCEWCIPKKKIELAEASGRKAILETLQP